MDHERRFTLDKIRKRLALIEPWVYRQRSRLGAFKYAEHPGPEEVGLVTCDVDDSQWPQIEPLTYWGGWNTNFTLRTQFSLPQDWVGSGALGLLLNLGDINNWDFCHPEALVYIDGKAIAGCDKYHHVVMLPADHCHDREQLLALSGYTGRWGYFEDPPRMKLFMGQSEIVQIDVPTQSFIATVRVALETARILDSNNPARTRILDALNHAFCVLDTREPLGDGFYDTVPPAFAILKDDLKLAGPGLDVDITAVGHSHIDVAWLWPLAQTRRKCGRSFHTVLQLMEAFDQYRFTQSQPQLYEYVRQDYPELFEKIKAKVAAGQWEATGGMWVEADCNLSGSESLVRQFLLGRTFFAEHFGPDAETPILWLPDVFGYAYCLPQLIKQAGLEYFFTIKLSWNQCNRIPYDSFWWQGIDGTKVLTHLGTTMEANSKKGVTYNGTAVPEEILNTWTNTQQKADHRHLMTVFGHGDGGGGPTREMLENIREMEEFPGLPRTRHGRAIDFFRDLEETSGNKLPTWNGELYLELHRGTYTTQARNKRANRKSEFLLHDTEWLAAALSVMEVEFAYPHAALREAWQLVCLNQFHDIIPGSSIGEVYTESLAQYDRVKQIVSDVQTKALFCLGQAMGGELLLANPTAFEQEGPMLWNTETVVDHSLCRADGHTVLMQKTDTGLLIDAGPIVSLSFVSLTKSPEHPSQAPTGLIVSTDLLENNQLRIELNAQGDMVRIFDKANHREVLPEGAIANQFQAFEDRPIEWDAWDIEIYYDDKMWTAQPAQSIRVVETGPLRATLEIKRTILNSPFTQRISLDHNSSQLDIHTDIDWQEKHCLLKAAFPVEVHANEATYDIQWGSVQRPTHQNTSWDWARFEVCAQKWVDLSEGNYGVSLLNDCKYGHDIKDNLIRISLLRSPTMPDPSADTGRHQFTYSLFPHAGRWDSRTQAAAYKLNDPVIVFAPESSPSQASQPRPIEPVVTVDADHVIIETIKQAENGEGIIVRMFESRQQRGKVTVTAGFNLGQAYKTNLLEARVETLDVVGSTVTLNMKPFEIVTLLLIPVGS